MSAAAITVEGLGKMYRLGAVQKRTETFQEMLKAVAMAPLRRLRHPGGQATEQEEFWALKDVSFEVQPGEVVGIIGRNGAGKSTLLKVLSRIVEPTRGQAIMRGRVSSLLEVGTGFHPELTGRENIYLNGSILGMKRREIDSQFDEIVAFAEVERFLDTPVKRFSSGMYVRLAFAVAAHLNPEILIVDEVLAVGDAEFQRKCLGKMREVSLGHGRTIIFVSHNMDAVLALCGRGALFVKGQLAMHGPTAEVVTAYQLSASKAEPEYRIRSPKLQWLGVIGLGHAVAIDPSADLRIVLQFQTKYEALANVEFDCAVLNEREQFVLHCRSRYLGHRFSLPANCQFSVELTIQTPRLGPGRYTLVAFAACGSEVLACVEQIPIGFVAALSNIADRGVLDGFRGAVLPEFYLGVTVP